MQGGESTQDEVIPGRMRIFLAHALRELGHDGPDFLLSPLAGDGSTRRFWRIHVPEAGMNYVAVHSEPRDAKTNRENRSYLLIGRHLLSRGVPVPEIHGWDMASGFFIMEDLGDENLQEGSRKGDPLPLYRQVLRVLLEMQIHGSEGFDPGWTSQTERYDRSVMSRYEADYFKEAFLCRYLGLKSEWPELQPSFDLIADGASTPSNGFFLHRDFQSRNILIPAGKIGIIDWQGGRLGPLGYDLASLVIDPYTGLSPGDREEIYRSYVRLLGDWEPTWVNPLEESFPYLALQRNLQILGAFAYLSKVGGKGYFETYIPGAVGSLQGLLKGIPGTGLAPLRDLVASIQERLSEKETLGQCSSFLKKI